jgi:YHS domain-containing protein/thioredoxin-related protein
MTLSWRVAVLVMMLAGSWSPAQAQQKWLSDLAQARAEAQRLNRPILCHFGAEWCVPCTKMEKTVLNEPGVLRQLGTTVVGVKIDVDKHPELAKRFGVSKFPTDLFIEPNGMLLLESQGIHAQDEYVGMMQRAATRYADLVAKRNAKPEPGAPEIAPVVQKTLPPVMDGFCPVTLWKHRRWEQGSEQFKADYKGQTYLLASAEAARDFTQDPEKYVPRFLGCDPVLVWDTDRAVPGKTQFGAFYDNELYLFVSDDNRKAFKANPDKYIRTRVVLSKEHIELELR